MIKTNDDQQIYVIPCGNGYTCLGYDVCLDKSKKYSAWLRALGIRIYSASRSKRGTVEAYQRYQQILDRIKQIYETQNIRCGEELQPRLIGLEGWRVEVITPEGNSRRFNVGVSTGWIPCHVEVNNIASHSGVSAFIAPEDTIQKVRFIRRPTSHNIFTTESLKALARSGVNMKSFKGI